MTEKQGGSDVRANTTTATPVGAAGEGREYTLVGHKWFTSAPMSDGCGRERTLPPPRRQPPRRARVTRPPPAAPSCRRFLTLAQTAEGVSCFLVPRWLPDGPPRASSPSTPTPRLRASGRRRRASS